MILSLIASYIGKYKPANNELRTSLGARPVHKAATPSCFTTFDNIAIGLILDFEFICWRTFIRSDGVIVNVTMVDARLAANDFSVCEM